MRTSASATRFSGTERPASAKGSGKTWKPPKYLLRRQLENALLEDELFTMSDRLTLSRTRKDDIIDIHRGHGERLKKVESRVDQSPDPDCDHYKKYRNDLRRILLDRGGLTPYTIRKCQKPTVVEELKKNHAVHCRRVKHASSKIDCVLSNGCESTRARNRLRNRREHAGPVACLIEKLAIKEREKLDRDAAARGDFADVPLYGAADPSSPDPRRRTPQRESRPKSAPSSRASPVRARGPKERRMLEYERKDNCVRDGKLFQQPAILPRRLREEEQLRLRYQSALAAASRR